MTNDREWLYEQLARERMARYGYDKTLDDKSQVRYVSDLFNDPNLRRDVDAIVAAIGQGYDESEASLQCVPARGDLHPELAEYFARAIREAREERDKAQVECAELRQIFDLQWSRMGTAAELWRQDAPISRTGVTPDLGELLNWLMNRSAADRARANEAAKLSADALDLVDDKDKVITDLYERIGIVEDEKFSRELAYETWAVVVCQNHGLDIEQDDLFDAISRHVRDLTTERDQLEDLADERASELTAMQATVDRVRALAMKYQPAWGIREGMLAALDGTEPAVPTILRMVAIFDDVERKRIDELMALRAVAEAAKALVADWWPANQPMNFGDYGLTAALNALNQISGGGGNVRTPSPAEHEFDEASVLNLDTGEPYGPGPLWAGTEPMDYPDPLCICGAPWGEDDRCLTQVQRIGGFHRYLSWACWHGHEPGRGKLHDGTDKNPAQCKFCEALCWCPCHDEVASPEDCPPDNRPIYTTGTGQVLRVHREEECSGQCPIHSPSDHGMVTFPTHWRDDRGIMERICSCGVGHPDPDDRKVRLADGGSIHGCCSEGCCSKEASDD